MADARTIKRHSSLLDEKNYNDMAKVNLHTVVIQKQIWKYGPMQEKLSL